jgi:hypothetical protein
MEAHVLTVEKSFHESFEKFLGLVNILEGQKSLEMNLSSLESMVELEGREVLRTLLEEHIEFRGPGDIGEAVEGTDGILRKNQRQRSIMIKTIFGSVKVNRKLYGKAGANGLSPKEAMLNLPDRSYSHQLQRRLTIETAKGSFEESIEAVKAQTGVTIPKRQTELIAQEAAQDFEDFYEMRSKVAGQKVAKKSDLIVLTSDAKGIVMRKEDLREETRKRAEKMGARQKKRLKKGEKNHSKRMAQVAAVYSVQKHERSIDQIMRGKKSDGPPRPENKRVWASIKENCDNVIADMFEEGLRRDPYQQKTWAALVDGNKHQIKCIEREAQYRNLDIYVVLDIIHVIEYLWKASRNFFSEGSSECETWVTHYLEIILKGKAKQAAGSMRRSATLKKLKNRELIDKCAEYLHNNAPYMQYDKYLKQGLPIGTGVIEGACRHLVKDRMDITGARWSLDGAEAILKLRAIYSSKDWHAYWEFHEKADFKRNHGSAYVNQGLFGKDKLRLVK